MGQRRMKVHEAFREAARAARAAHWTITITGSNHLKWQPPSGRFVITSKTPRSGNRSVENDLAALRKAGLPC